VIAFLLVLMTAAAEQPMIDGELSGQCEVEDIAIYASGFAHFTVSNSCGTAPHEFTSGLRQLSGAQLQKLEAAIIRSDFDSLPERIEPDPNVVGTEEDLFTIRVRRSGISKRVHAFALDRARDTNAAARFQALWAAVVEYGPKETK
jgi:hypothetical protein